jgi:hypothetical protein
LTFQRCMILELKWKMSESVNVEEIIMLVVFIKYTIFH